MQDRDSKERLLPPGQRRPEALDTNPPSWVCRLDPLEESQETQTECAWGEGEGGQKVCGSERQELPEGGSKYFMGPSSSS